MLLQRVGLGDDKAEAQLISQIYSKLHALAGACLRREYRTEHTLQATAIVNEAFIRLFRGAPVPWNDRIHFFRVASHVIRVVLVDHGRRRRSAKRGGNAETLCLTDELQVSAKQSQDVLDVNDALERLEQMDKRQAQIVEMRFFGGLTEEEIAEVLGISSRTVKRDWTMARSWLHAELSPKGG